MDLTQLRARIDEIDEQLTTLLCQRMDCSAAVAAYKIQHHLPVLNADREQQVLDKVREQIRQQRPDDAGYPQAAALVFATMMDTSRALQHRRMEAGETLRSQIAAARKRPLATGATRVACAGCAGAFAHQAALTMFPFCREKGREPLFVSSFADVFAAVEEGRVDYGVLPVENSSTGSVNEVFDLILAHRFSIVSAAVVEVHHCLLGLPGAKKITEVYSHHQALSQCGEYIAAHGLHAHAYANTAMAAEMVARQGNPAVGAIASEQAAKLYGLQIVQRDIQSIPHNCTRFIAISKTPVIPPDADKISLIFSIPHTTGSLYRTLSRFAIDGLNLTKIESRPMRTGDFEYAFYLDFEGGVDKEETLELLCALSEEMPQFTFLGNYHEWT